MFRSWTVRTKIIVITGSALLLTAGAIFWGYALQAKQSAVDAIVAQSRGILLTGESAREEMASKWRMDMFHSEQLADWAQEGELEKVLAAVPVVTAWRTVMAKAEEAGYDFRVPKVHPRNPNNEPDEVERRVLETFRQDADLAEHHEIDHENNTVRYFRPIRLTRECLICHGDPTQSVALWNNDKGLDPTGTKMENWQVGELHGAFEVIQSLDSADAQTNATLAKGLGLVTIALAVGSSLLYLFVTRWISRPLREAVTCFGAFANGDLTQHLDVHSDDEVGQVCRGANQLMDSLRTMIASLRNSAGELVQSSMGLCQTSIVLAGGADETTSRTSTVASAAEEMSINMSNMAASSDQMTDNVKTVALAVDEMTSSISEIAKNAEQASSVAGNAAELAYTSNSSISQLGAAADEIGKVIETIQDIAEQTNLLALNATIEAARAGEAGKGFAVVATEVKDLAKQTADATEDIRQRIEGIQNSTGEAVTSIGQISEVIQKVNDVSKTIASAVEEQSITTKEIAASITQTSSAAGVVSNGVAESAAASQEITQSIAGVEQAARRTAEIASETQLAGGKLSKWANQLLSLVKEFKLGEEAFSAASIKAAHALWKQRLADLVAGQSNAQELNVSDHHSCALGQWYDGPANDLYRHLEAFREVGSCHEEIHRAAAEIAHLCHTNQHDKARQEFLDFEKMTMRLFQRLDRLEQELHQHTPAPTLA
jgi:methyl-accepting chemotaxis protein